MENKNDLLEEKFFEELSERIPGMFYSSLDSHIHHCSERVAAFYKIPSWWKYVPLLRRLYYKACEDLEFYRFAINFYSYVHCVGFDDFMNFVKEKKQEESARDPVDENRMMA